MSFHVEFNAACIEDAQKIISEEHLPDTVRSFIQEALQAYPDSAVHVKAIGHLQTQPVSYMASNADIVVNAIVMKSPKESPRE